MSGDRSGAKSSQDSISVNKSSYAEAQIGASLSDCPWHLHETLFEKWLKQRRLQHGSSGRVPA
jgi:hypothetical protein